MNCLQRFAAKLTGTSPSAPKTAPRTAPATEGPPIYVVRQTALVTDADVRAMCEAIDIQVVRDFAPAHNLLPSRVRFTSPDKVTKADRVIALVDDAGEGALGWHTLDEGDFVFGTVGVRAILENGGRILAGPNSVSTVLSHEVLELLGNETVSLWADTGQGYFVPYEMCDAVQALHYDVNNVSVSDWLTKDWFSPAVSAGDRFDFLGALTAPFELAPGGYTLRCQGGEITTVYAATPPPEWLIKRKHELSSARTNRLITSRPR